MERQLNLNPALTPAAHPLSDSQRAYRVYVVAVIWLVLLLRLVDLQVISVLLEPIKKEFAVSDTQLGLLTGMAFSVFYGLLGIPVAWLADRSNRRNIIAAAVGLWSLMTVSCGLAGSFLTLCLARVGVGVGEAGGSAPAYSLISDYVPQRRRASVFAVLNSAIPVGVFAGLLIGGFVSVRYGWRTAFIAAGAPGILVALLVWLTVREPPRGLSELKTSEPDPIPFRIAAAHLLRIPSYRHFVIGSTVFTMGAMGSGIWIPSFFIRIHEMPASDAAVWLACVYGGGGLLGVLGGGYIADRLVERTGDARWYAWLSAICAVSILPFSLLVYLWPNPIQALVIHLGTTVLMHAWMGPLYGTIQSVVGLRRRALAAAMNMLTINLIGYGLGPLFVGLGADTFRPYFGADSLRYSLLALVVIAYTWAGVHFLLAARSVRRDLTEAD